MISAVRKLTEEYEIKVSDEHIKAAVKNIELLHLGDDGFIAIAAKEDKEWSQFHYKVEDLLNNIAKAISLEANVYITPNSFFRPFRKIENIRHLNALYIDVDYYKIEKYKECDHEYMMNMIRYEYFESGLLPEPTFTLFTGQGLAYYWKIESCPITILPLWNVIQRYFLETLQDVGGDIKSIDAARVMRLAGSLHMETNKRAEFYVNDDNLIYRLGDIQKNYLPELSPNSESIGDRVHKVKHLTSEEFFEKNEPKKKARTSSKSKVSGLYNQLKLHYTRFMDLVKLQELREGYCRNAKGELTATGDRETMCFLYRYWYSLYCNDLDLALQNTLEFNQGFKEPLPSDEVIKITASAARAYDEWLADENEPDESKRGKTIRNKKYKHKGYNYSNSTLIKILNITDEEMEELQTIISGDEKNRRKNIKERAARRIETGLTKKQIEKLNRLEEVQKLYEQGYKQIEIAKKLNLDKRIISRDLKAVKKISNPLTKNYKNNNVLMLMGLFIPLFIKELNQKFYDYFSIFDMFASLNFDAFI